MQIIQQRKAIVYIPSTEESVQDLLQPSRYSAERNAAAEKRPLFGIYTLRRSFVKRRSRRVGLYEKCVCHADTLLYIYTRLTQGTMSPVSQRDFDTLR